MNLEIEKSEEGNSFNQRKSKGIFTWWLPPTIWDKGEIICPLQYKGCGKRHQFILGDNRIEFNWIEDSCIKFEDFIDWAKSEWLEFYAEKYQEREGREEKIIDLRKAGVNLNEQEFDKKLGYWISVGYRINKKEFFICSSCKKKLRGASNMQKSLNRNNPYFWKIEVKEKILCLACLGKKYHSLLSREMKNTFWKYLKRGYE